MRFDVLTLFPDMFESFIHTSIIGKAVDQKKLLEIHPVNIRDYSKEKHKKVDDTPYGGGNGMVMAFQPVYDAYQAIARSVEKKPTVIYLSPQGKVFHQKMAHELAGMEHIVLLCGHYEGMDERIIEEIVDMEVSIGDYVLTGGELPAMVLMDSVARLLPGVLSSAECYLEESHSNQLLEYPQYTRPEEICGRKVPEVLLSGHHENIRRWRQEQSVLRTQKKRPDLYQAFLKKSDNNSTND